MRANPIMSNWISHHRRWLALASFSLSRVSNESPRASPLIGDGGEQRKLGQAVWLAGIGMCIVTRWLDVLWVL